MDYKKFNSTIMARIDKDEEIISKVMEICEKENIKLANINALGAVDEIVIGLFDTGEKKYYSEKFTGDFEIVSLTGSITTKNGELYNHLHISVGDREYNVRGGHLNSAVVSATCELFIHIINGMVEREFNDEVGLNLLKF